MVLQKMRQFQDARARRDLPHRRLHRHDRRPQRQEHDPAAAHPAGGRWRTPRPTRSRSSKILDPDKTDDAASTPSGWTAMVVADFIKLASGTDRGPHAGARRLREALPDSSIRSASTSSSTPLCRATTRWRFEADVELGGTDQMFNLLVGRELQTRLRPGAAGHHDACRCSRAPDGVQKMSKSYNNYIGVDERPPDMFGKVMSISDALMWKYYELLSGLHIPEIAAG
ncbi:MAG: hypothetical protein MZV70_57475 [Desulfobacterales bacterium]|nr:hypothetical protein [Desulfobacterales bacterium]